jgi:hypothetical protein
MKLLPSIVRKDLIRAGQNYFAPRVVAYIVAGHDILRVSGRGA